MYWREVVTLHNDNEIPLTGLVEGDETAFGKRKLVKGHTGKRQRKEPSVESNCA